MLLVLKGSYICHDIICMTIILEKSLSSGLIQSHNHFWGDLCIGNTYSWGLIYGIIFVSGVIHICYLYLKKEEWNKTKKQCSCSKMWFYYLAAYKTLDVFHNLGPLNWLRLKNIWGGVLISVDLLKITLLLIFFLYFYNRLIFGKGGLIHGTTFVLVFWWTYIRGAYTRSFTV